MKITIEPSEPQDDKEEDTQFPTVSVEIGGDDPGIVRIIDLFKWALAAYGYDSEIIDKNLEKLYAKDAPRP